MDSITNLLLSSFLCSILVGSTTAVKTISTTQSVKDGDTIVSIGGSFAHGFFSPGSSKNRYVGIWYNKISNDSRTFVWVANRETPVTDSSGVLMVTQQAIFVLLNSTESIIWSSNLTKPGKNPVAELLDSGNFVLRNADDDNPENYLWQSFDYPTDTFLPGMKFGIHYKTGLDMIFGRGIAVMIQLKEIILTVWILMDFHRLWNGVRFSGMPTISSNPIYNFTFVLNQNETYFNYDLLNSSVVTRMVMNQDGVLRRMKWIEGSSTSWVEHLTTEMTNCNTFAFCGPYGLCTVNNSPECSCLQRFGPKFPKDWVLGQAGHNWNEAKTIIVISVVLIATLIIGLGISSYISKKKGRTIDHPEQGCYKESQNEDIELPLFHLVTITKATDYFAINNKLGEGGFGPVYKGMLEGGHDIAVKLLLKDSKQGVDEFKNEVICIARLQHRNLVKLLGYCIQGDKRILIYEFMPNNNLDSFIFGMALSF
ncbi:G-type lectin S-receptor-like serine/threonine-protein kinase At4g27290 [Camellia sinensis]|uniref:G-type lectin S-receptor-like serine/threonine-protein kinase At4g27290 n=1 Tax=Camellia sinensis TaxID=4442 RepID=UPI001036A4D0|nr:G-type lectin S-receptor-like serine/threonine-protein kinase At4g27290 [Camellia sinensis]